MRTVAVVLAAGASERFGQDKLWLDLAGEPLWLRSYWTLQRCAEVEAVGVVCQPGRRTAFARLAAGALFIVEGGASRQESSRKGVEAVPEEFDAILVHDAARPCLQPSLVSRVVQGVRESGAAFPALPLVDTVKRGHNPKWETLDRASLVAVQTPQGARRELLVRAHQRADRELTDEAALIEALGEPVAAVEGDWSNIKVTRPHDLSRILGPVETRTGLGYDVHAFSSDSDRPLWLGGVEFDDRPGLEGHSDADVLLHAIVDALLGAAGLGDIGQRYPNTDPRWKDAPSSVFLEETGEAVRGGGWEVANIDATVIAERPRVMGRSDEMRQRIARVLAIGTELVSVKATTNEGLGSIGRSEGIAAFAVATLKRAEWSPQP